MAMADIRMTVYNAASKLTGVYHWIDAEEYREAEKFLSGIGASRTPPGDAVNMNADFYLEGVHQLSALGRYYHRVRINRPKIGLPRLDIEIYVNGGHGPIFWANEEEYQQAKKLLADMGIPPTHVINARYENAESFYLDTREQYQALLALQKSFEEKRGK
jgi:hypothetical protein